jgi:hypothetical protein
MTPISSGRLEPGVADASPTPTFPAEGMRTLLSLLLFAHFFALGSGILSNGTASRLELLARRAKVLTGYLQILGLDASYQFHLTYGDASDFDHFVTAEFSTTDGQTATRTLPALGVFPGHRYRRLERLARAIATPPAEGDPFDLVARRLAVYWMAETGALHGTLRAPEANVELLREEGTLESPRWTNSADFRDRYYRDGYEAYAILVDGEVELMRTAEPAETAPSPAGTR